MCVCVLGGWMGCGGGGGVSIYGMCVCFCVYIAKYLLRPSLPQPGLEMLKLFSMMWVCTEA